MVDKSPIKMSVKEYRKSFEKNLNQKLDKGESFLSAAGQKKVRAAHNETKKKLGYTEEEASKRQIQTERAQGKSKYKAKEALKRASTPPAGVKKPVKKAPSKNTKPPKH